MRRHRRGRSQMAAMDQINVTPLLDLVFLLLIAFMITMPLMEYGTTIKAPEMNAQPLPEEAHKTVELSKTGTVLFDGEAITVQELIAKLKELHRDAPKTIIMLRADAAGSYGSVIKLMKEIKTSGFEDVTLVTQAEGNSK